MFNSGCSVASEATMSLDNLSPVSNLFVDYSAAKVLPHDLSAVRNLSSNNSTANVMPYDLSTFKNLSSNYPATNAVLVSNLSPIDNLLSDCLTAKAMVVLGSVSSHTADSATTLGNLSSVGNLSSNCLVNNLSSVDNLSSECSAANVMPLDLSPVFNLSPKPNANNSVSEVMCEKSTKSSRKRLRNGMTSKAVARMMARQAGLEYMSSTGIMIPRKLPAIYENLCNCKKKCSEKISSEERASIFNNYYNMDETSKNVYLFESISSMPQKVKLLNVKKPRSATFAYCVTLSGNKILICKEAFCALHRITASKVRFICNKVASGKASSLTSKRGKHSNRPFRKRLCIGMTWKSFAKKKARQADLENISSTDIMMLKKLSAVGDDLCSCKKKCSEKISSEERASILNNYYNMDETSKNVYLFKSIASVPQKVKLLNVKKPRSTTFAYSVTSKGNKLLICKEAFCALHRITASKVRFICNKIASGKEFPLPSKRGKQSNQPSQNRLCNDDVTWKAVARKKARQAGLDFMSSPDIMVQKKFPTSDEDLCSCKKKCSKKISSEERASIFNNYYNMDETSKNMYLFESIASVPQKVKLLNVKKPRAATFAYSVTSKGNKILICKEAFCALHRITASKVRFICNKMASSKVPFTI